MSFWNELAFSLTPLMEFWGQGQLGLGFWSKISSRQIFIWFKFHWPFSHNLSKIEHNVFHKLKLSKMSKNTFWWHVSNQKNNCLELIFELFFLGYALVLKTSALQSHCRTVLTHIIFKTLYFIYSDFIVWFFLDFLMVASIQSIHL